MGLPSLTLQSRVPVREFIKKIVFISRIAILALVVPLQNASGGSGIRIADFWQCRQSDKRI